MFFIGIFGIETKEKILGFISNLNCKNCNNSNIQIIKRFSFFHFFFIPLFKWNIEYFALCKSCNSIYKIKKEKGIEFEKGNKDAITYWDIKELNLNGCTNKTCPNCHKKLEKDFEFCPYCGYKINK